MSLAVLAPVANHIWQSTLCAAAVAVLVRVFRTQGAHVRYGLWWAASLKFLVPFAVLVAVGTHVGWRSAAVVQPNVAVVIDAISQPFSSPVVAVTASPVAASSHEGTVLVLLLLLWGGGCAMSLAAWWVRWRRVVAIVRNAVPVAGGRELEALRRLEQITGTSRPLTLVLSEASLEPGVVGIFNPTFVWPRVIGAQLADCQVEAILAHEWCHVRRRDNFTAAMHMVVEAVFWFHPLVWWLETRLVEERERACDEAVIRWGSEPQAYAESIVKMCEGCIASPFSVAGVTGADLTRRVEAIMRNRVTEPVTTWRRLVLATVGVAVLAWPIAAGVSQSPALHAESPPAADAPRLAFEVASITPHPADDHRAGDGTSTEAGGICSPWGWMRATDTCFRARNISLRELVIYAFRPSGLVPPQPPIVGGPPWLNADRFDIVARATGNAPSEPFREAQLAPMVRTLLADRFKLTLHHESRPLPVYVLHVTRPDHTIGPHLRPAMPECVAKITAFRAGLSDGAPTSPHDPCVVESSPGHVQGGGMDLAQLAWMLSNRFNRVVRDETGLTGFFAIDLAWPPESDHNGPVLATALQDELGLTLEATTGPVDVLIIDHAEPPTPD